MIFQRKPQELFVLRGRILFYVKYFDMLNILSLHFNLTRIWNLRFKSWPSRYWIS